MKRIFVLLTAVCLAALLTLSLLPSLNGASSASITAEGAGVAALTPLTDYGAWFQQQTGHTPDADYFGAYAFMPISDTLYIGFGAARPAEADGAILAQTDGVTITAVSTLTEQGFIGMARDGDALIIPGVDPCCDDDWAWGNAYVYKPPHSLVKHRNLPDVIHSWGLWVDETAGTLYTAVSFSPDGGDSGGVFSSADQAQSWMQIADSTDGVGLDRTYDIIGQHEKFYITWNDVYTEACGLAVSENIGQTWSRIGGIQTACRPRLAVFQDNVLALRNDRAALYAINAAGTAVTHTLPGFQAAEWVYNYLTVDGDGALYIIADDGRVLRTTDFTTWETVIETDLDFVAIGYWPEKNWLILSNRGSTAGLWRFDLAAPSLAPRAKYLILLIADGWGANHIAAANDYAGTAPAYQSWPRSWLSTFPAGGGYDSNLAWSDFAYALINTTDSAAAATAMYAGVKTANGRIAIDENAAARLETISEKARAFGQAAGAVSSVHVSHATPGAWMAHNDGRSNGYAIADEGFWGDPNATGTVLDNSWYGGGHGPTLPPLGVVIGAGHPDWHGGNYVNTAMRDKLSTESGEPGAFVFIERIAGNPDGGDRLLAAANLSTTTQLAGLFGGTGGNLEYRLADGSGHDLENPTLAQMTTAALMTLNRSPNGFVLMVEGGAVDWASHSNSMDAMIGEMIGFNEAVQTVTDWVDAPDNGSSWDNTLVIVTGDHETGYLTAGLGIFPDQPLGAVTSATLALEKVVSSAGRRASWEDDGNDEIDVGETVYWAWNSGGHSNSLIPLYAQGVGAELFAAHVVGADPARGPYVDNTAVFQIMDAVVRPPDLFLPLIIRQP
ncbi:MAG: hypothetical protein GY803_13380 [Chloroflexi bacterium]|nr:hypothetical protein [Chloroflexota bacterium]